MKYWCVMVVAVLLFSTFSYGEEKDTDKEVEGGEAPPLLERPIYVPVKPAFVVNYGGPGKLKYLKLDISLRVKDTNSSNAARHHMPLIRDYLVRLFSRQTDEDIDTREGKEDIRIAALEGLQNLLLEEDGEQGITNLYFNNFVIQR
jgi:flagellar FliL protein